jgi:hypothetical protein
MNGIGSREIVGDMEFILIMKHVLNICKNGREKRKEHE